MSGKLEKVGYIAATPGHTYQHWCQESDQKIDPKAAQGQLDPLVV